MKTISPILLIFLYIPPLPKIDTVLIFDSNGLSLESTNCHRIIHNILEQIEYPIRYVNVLNISINNLRDGGHCDATTLWFLYHIIIKKIYTENNILELARNFEIQFYNSHLRIKNPIWLNNQIKILLQTKQTNELIHYI